MRIAFAPLFAVSLLAVSTMAPRAFGGPTAHPPAPCPPGPRAALIPVWYEKVTRCVPVPACIKERQVAVYETALEAVTEKQRVPHYDDVLCPVWGTREVPVWESRKTAVCGDVAVPVYAMKKLPVMGVCWACSNVEKQVPLWWREEEQQCGVRHERRVLGFREERVCVGKVLEKIQVGTRTERRRCGWDEKEVIVGTKEVRRKVGWRTEAYVAIPARTLIDCELITHPVRWVTVLPPNCGPVSPLPGTDAVFTQAQYTAEVERIWPLRR